jgi:hypothetical protein
LTDVLELIEKLETRAEEFALIATLATDLETRRKNIRLANEERAQAARLKADTLTVAAGSFNQPERRWLLSSCRFSYPRPARSQ